MTEKRQPRRIMGYIRMLHTFQLIVGDFGPNGSLAGKKSIADRLHDVQARGHIEPNPE